MMDTTTWEVKFERVQKHFKYKTRHIAGCLITHEHGDHAKYTAVCRQWCNQLYDCWNTTSYEF